MLLKLLHTAGRTIANKKLQTMCLCKSSSAIVWTSVCNGFNSKTIHAHRIQTIVYATKTIAYRSLCMLSKFLLSGA